MEDDRTILIHFLEDVIPFRFLPGKKLLELSEKMVPVAGSAGGILSLAGDGGIRPESASEPGIVFVLKGSLQLLEQREDGTLEIRDRLGSGRFLGEWELLFGGTRGYSLRLENDCSLCFLDGSEFLSLIREYPPFARGLSSLLRDRQGVFQAFDRFRAELSRGIAFGHVDLEDLLPLYGDLNPALHPGASDADEPDPAALQYAVKRLPNNITRTFAFLLRDELPEEFSPPDRFFQPQPSPGRRRAVWEMLPGKNLVLLRSGLSDITDLITLMCLYATEARKLRKHMYAVSAFGYLKTWLEQPGTVDKKGVENRQQAEQLLARLGFNADMAGKLLSVWPGHSIQRLYEIAVHREMFSIDIRRQRNSYNSRRTESWTSQIRRAAEKLIGASPNDLDDDYPVHIVSSNTHSLTNCLNPWFREQGERIIQWAESSGHPVCGYRWKNRQDMMYALGRDFLQEHPEERDAFELRAREAGIVRLEKTLATGIEVQLIDGAKARGRGMDSLLPESASSDPCLIVNIDYAFGEQAEHILRNLILLFHRNIRSVNFLGKAGALAGRRGDILIPTSFIHQQGDELQAPIPPDRLQLQRLEAAIGAERVHPGPMVTVEGTLLQNRMMLNYYRHLWSAVGIEMEGSFYHHEVVEAQHSGLLPKDMPQRYFYYVSDLPLGTGHNLSTPMAAAEGVPPLYAVTREVLRGIWEDQ
ncbi:DUF6909 family protein [Salinispira pacifica]|uniref:Cyclic nucleotide-binding domain-containing protein n=1 Tax=Salinispira pacifica TaxID=1307761 RepID=V5WNM9_9SPIO|nr:cyclic nucleotide-binding domain-containing protein [Salinispira pacifica]AHC16616.1 hypothetical protein L21SP2_3276 [Salinispira pacifica]